MQRKARSKDNLFKKRSAAGSFVVLYDWLSTNYIQKDVYDKKKIK